MSTQNKLLLPDGNAERRYSSSFYDEYDDGIFKEEHQFSDGSRVLIEYEVDEQNVTDVTCYNRKGEYIPEEEKRLNSFLFPFLKEAKEQIAARDKANGDEPEPDIYLDRCISYYRFWVRDKLAEMVQ